MDALLKGLKVYFDRPGILNKRVMDVITVDTYKIPKTKWTPSDIIDLVNTSNGQSNGDDAIRKTFNGFRWLAPCLKKLEPDNDVIYVFLRKILKRKSLAALKIDPHGIQDATELVLIDFENSSVTYVPINNEANVIPKCVYEFYLIDGNIIDVKYVDDQCLWLRNVVLKKIIQWSQELEDDNQDRGSLKLISVSKYNKVYEGLKVTYAPKLLDMWSRNEKTDPIKFIYEDLAIAAYLLILWEEERSLNGSTMKQSFIDLGCGNGLLVYILSKEGHRGIGIDVRKRNIWAKFANDCSLIEKTFTPNECMEYPDIDWIIGNHSDELTVWIPVIASRSSYDMKAFILPCCSYEFTGQKYRRRNQSVSQYACFLDYVSNCCDEFGFLVKRDRLRIPSTKRICLICDSRKYKREDHIEYKEKVDKIVDEKMTEDFKARSQKERVKNCTQVPNEEKNSMVKFIADILIDRTSVTLIELTALIKPESMVFLKRQCGGLKTLLRNHQYIFKVDGDVVLLNWPKPIEEISTKYTSFKPFLKTRPCWFDMSHPDGCPMAAEQCRYSHKNVFAKPFTPTVVKIKEMADHRATKSGFAAEAHKKVLAKYDSNLASQLLAWIKEVVEEDNINDDGDDDNFYETLKDGTLLCRLINALQPNTIAEKKINKSKMAFKCMENITHFVTAAQQLGVPTQETFQTVDLWEKQNLNSVIICLESLARKAGKYGKRAFGPREAEANVRHFSEEQLKAGQTVISYQYGGNKGATQSGINFGNTRHM